MSITFHCEHCGKKIEARDGSGGKWGKCPACHNKVYIPDLDGEELKLAPVDEDEIERQEKLKAETRQITQDILEERAVPDDAAGPAGEAAVPREDLSDKELTGKILRYLHQMADGDLQGANRTAAVVKVYGSQALKILDRIAVSDMPDPKLNNVPPHVLSGFMRTLRSQIE